MEDVDVELEFESKEMLYCTVYHSSSTVVGASARTKHTCFQFALPVLSVSV